MLKAGLNEIFNLLLKLVTSEAAGREFHEAGSEQKKVHSLN